MTCLARHSHFFLLLPLLFLLFFPLPSLGMERLENFLPYMCSTGTYVHGASNIISLSSQTSLSSFPPLQSLHNLFSPFPPIYSRFKQNFPLLSLLLYSIPPPLKPPSHFRDRERFGSWFVFLGLGDWEKGGREGHFQKTILGLQGRRGRRRNSESGKEGKDGGGGGEGERNLIARRKRKKKRRKETRTNRVPLQRKIYLMKFTSALGFIFGNRAKSRQENICYMTAIHILESGRLNEWKATSEEKKKRGRKGSFLPHRNSAE